MYCYPNALNGISFAASLANTMALKKAQTSLTIDETQTYSADAQLAVSESAVKTVYEPTLTIIIPNKPTMSVAGTFTTGTGQAVASVDLAVKNFSRKPITLKSSLSKIKDGSSYEFKSDLNSEMLTSTVSSTVSVQPKNYNGQAEVVYTLQGRPEHRITVGGKFGDASRGDLMSYSIQGGFIPTEFPEYQFNVESSIEVSASHVDTELSLEFSEEKLSFAHRSVKQGTWDSLTLTSSSSFKYPAKVCYLFLFLRSHVLRL